MLKYDKIRKKTLKDRSAGQVGGTGESMFVNGKEDHGKRIRGSPLGAEPSARSVGRGS